MKKTMTLCALVLVLGLFACAGSGGGSDDPKPDNTPDSPNTSPTTEPSVNIFINQLEPACLPSGNTEVSAYVSVIDEMGKLIDSLDLSNFQIAQESTLIPPESVFFATSDDLIPEPISVAILMDYSKSMTDVPTAQTAMEDAVTGFIDLMQLGDQAEIIKFNTGIRYLLPFTDDKSLLKAGVAYLENVGQGYTYLYDTLYSGIQDTGMQSGRKAVIALTDGRDNRTNEFPGDGRTLQDVIALAKTNEVPLFLIGLGEDINVEELQEMTEETGGHFYPAATSNELDEIYTNISDLLNIEQYLLAFEVTANGTDMSSLMFSINYNGLTDSVDTAFPFAVCP